MSALHVPPFRILVVDDDFLASSYAKQLLEVSGFEVVATSSGLDALRLLKQHEPFDLFVLDVVMPQMTGTELARHLRQMNPDTKILYVTGYTDRLFADKGALWD